MVEEPETRVLRPGIARYITLLVFCLLVGLAGVAAAALLYGVWTGWIAALFFFASAYGLTTYVKPDVFYLKLRADGFSLRSPGIDWGYGWDEVGEFTVVTLGRRTFVGFLPRDRAPMGGTAHDQQVILPDTHGLGAEEPAQTINTWRTCRLSQLASDAVPGEGRN